MKSFGEIFECLLLINLQIDKTPHVFRKQQLELDMEQQTGSK